jgi:hypothetical protein
MVTIPTNRNHDGIGLGCSRQLITQTHHTAAKVIEGSLLFNMKELRMVVSETMLTDRAAKRKKEATLFNKRVMACKSFDQ